MRRFPVRPAAILCLARRRARGGRPAGEGWGGIGARNPGSQGLRGGAGVLAASPSGRQAPRLVRGSRGRARLLRCAALLALHLSVVATPVAAVEPDEILADPALEARARTISQELRCLV